jgi:hypothetical protein
MDEDCTNEELGIWLRALLWKVANEDALGDMPESVPRSSPISNEELSTLASSCMADGMLLKHYPSSDISSMAEKREQGRLAARKRWDKKGNGSPTAVPDGSPNGSPNTDKIRLDKIREEEIIQDSERDPYGVDSVSDKPISDVDRWRYECMQPWAQSIKNAICKIGPNSWTQWKALVDKYGMEAVLSAASKVKAGDRFADAVTEKLEDGKTHHANSGTEMPF